MLVLPNQILANLNPKEDRRIFVVQYPTGYIITAFDPTVREQVEIGKAFMDSSRDAFAALARS